MSRILITGASKGIGRATAVEAVRRGHHVVATARRPETLEDIAGLTARLALDVTDDESVAAAVALAGPLDALVSVAGETLRAPVESVPLTEVEHLFRLNTVGALRVAQAVLPGFRRQGHGRALFVSSILGRIGLPLAGAYAASKWALEALAETLAIEAGPFGVQVTLLEPGSVGTGAAEAARVYLIDDDPYRGLAAGRVADPATVITPEEVAVAIVDTLELETAPLRVAVGTPARLGLADRRAAPEDVPFRWSPRVA